jgi:anaerobic carbon-monoxide dehydrogenase iron sulfur subunit
MLRVYPKEERCINCHLCEVACIVEHSETKNVLTAFHTEGLSFNHEDGHTYADPAEALEAGRAKPLNRTRVDVAGATFISTNCRHCEEPDCVLACKNGSLYKDSDGRVIVNEEKCVGCWMCVMACRYGAIIQNPTKKNVPDVANNGINTHCDLCPSREEPACVWICPTKALVYEDRELI